MERSGHRRGSEGLLRGGSNAASTVLLCHPADLAALLPDLSGRLLINSVFHVGAERLQQMLFSDSPFLQGFLQQCKFTGQGAELPWVQGRGKGGRSRRQAGPAEQMRQVGRWASKKPVLFKTRLDRLCL